MISLQTQRPVFGLSVGRSAFLSRRGFTLVELMVAMVCVGIVLVAAFTSAAQGRHMLEDARDMTRVGQILQSQMEDLRMLSWEDLEAAEAAASGGWAAMTLSREFVESYGEKYSIQRRIATRVDGATVYADQKEIMVKVTWEGPRGETHTRTTATWFTHGGMHDYLYRSF